MLILKNDVCYLSKQGECVGAHHLPDQSQGQTLVTLHNIRT